MCPNRQEERPRLCLSFRSRYQTSSQLQTSCHALNSTSYIYYSFAVILDAPVHGYFLQPGAVPIPTDALLAFLRVLAAGSIPMPAGPLHSYTLLSHTAVPTRLLELLSL